MKRMFDITLPVTEGMIAYPGNPATRLEPHSRIAHGDDANVTELRFGSHTGTHVDAARHFFDDGQAVDEGQVLVEWDPYTFSILTEEAGQIRFKDILEGITVHEEVDEVTGKVTVLRVFSAHDVGRAINPVSCEGQIQGGFVQGMGYALTEEMVWDDDGRLANPSFADYKVPGIKDSPAIITPILIEEPEPSHPFGAKGVGEISLVGAAPAIANAVANATGARLRRIPMTPERVLDALAP